MPTCPPPTKRDRSNRRMIGLSLDRDMAQEIKRFAAQRKLTTKALFLEILSVYREHPSYKYTQAIYSVHVTRKLSIDSHNPRQIIGLSLDPTLAVEMKALAKSKKITFKKLFIEMYTVYLNQRLG